MSAIQTLEAVRSLQRAVEGVGSVVDGIQKKLDEPDLGALRRDDQGRVVSFMEETDEEIEIRSTRDPSQASIRRSRKETKRHIARSLRAARYQPWGEFKSFADFVRAGMSNPQGHHFQERYGKHFGGMSKAIQGMNETSGADGGFTVMPEFSNRIMDRVFNNDLLSRTDGYVVSGNSMTFLASAESSRANGSRSGGVQGYWIGEGGAITKSKPTLREVSMKLMKVGVVVYLTDELIADNGTALEQYIAKCVSSELNFMVGDSLLNGSGVGQPLGILNSPALVSVAKETGQLAATLQSENIVKMYSRFFAPNLANAVWLHNQDIGPQLHTMTLGIGAAGVVTYQPPGGLSASPYATLMGQPMLATEFNPTLGTQGDLILADPSQILSITKGGVVQAESVHVEFLSDQVALRFTMRLNARPWETAPLTPYKGSSTQGNFVALDARA